MKKLLSCLLAVVMVSSVSSLSFAKGPFITPGARAVGYGTAFVSIADDLTAIYYNPAGLALQEDTQLMASVFYVNHDATSSSPILSEFETSAVVPFIGFSTKFYCDTTIAAGVYAIGGGGGKLKNLPFDLSPLYGYPAGTVILDKVEGEQSFMAYNISLAKQINDKLSVGIGFDAIEMKDKRVISSTMGMNCDYNRSAFGFQGNIGVMYYPLERLSTGFVLRSGTVIDLPEEKSGLQEFDKYTYPMTMELGISYDILDPLTISAAVAYNKYSWHSTAYRDTVQVKVGTEYRADDKLSLHIGFFNDPSIYENTNSVVRNNMMTITDIDIYDMNYLSVGAEYKITDPLKLAFTYTHSFTHSLYVDGVSYEYDIDVFRFDISYKFL